MQQIVRHEIGPRMSQMVVYGDTIYLCGQTAADRSVGAADQTRQILARIDELLAVAGSNKSRLLSVQIWLADIRYYDEMNAVWDAWVDPQNTPGRATCEARMAFPDVFVEIIAIAAKLGTAAK